jgi:hypothetical protein
MTQEFGESKQTARKVSAWDVAGFLVCLGITVLQFVR